MSTNRWVKTLVGFQVQTAMTYKVGFFMSLVVSVFPLLAKIVLWRAIFSAQPAGAKMAGFSYSDMVTYYLVFQFVYEISWTGIENYRIIPDIVRGRLSEVLMLPVSYTKFATTEYIGGIFAPRLLAAVLIYPGLMLCFWRDVSLHLNVAAVLLGLVSIILSVAYNYAYRICIGFMAFWMESRPPFAEILVLFMGGFIIPIDLMPAWLRNISVFLPFQYAIYLPVKIITGKITALEALPGVCMQVLWILVFIGAGKLLWRSGLKRFQAYGG